MRNVTTIQLDRYQSPGVTTVYQTRSSTTEVGWKLSPDFSMGGRALLNRINSDDPSVIQQVGEARDEYQVSMHNRRAIMRGFTTQLDAFVGVLDLHNTEQTKRGLSADANGRLRHVTGRWFTHEVSGHLSTDFTRLVILSTGLHNNPPDVIGDMNGNLTLFNQSRIGLRTAYNLQTSNVGQPGTGDTTISRLKSSRTGVDATLRTKIGGDGYVNVTESLSNAHQVTTINGPSSRRTAGLLADGQANWYGLGFEGRFQSALARGEVSTGSVNGSYAETNNTRSLEGAVNRRLLARLTTRLSARIGLTSYRYSAIGNFRLASHLTRCRLAVVPDRREPSAHRCCEYRTLWKLAETSLSTSRAPALRPITRTARIAPNGAGPTDSWQGSRRPSATRCRPTTPRTTS